MRERMCVRSPTHIIFFWMRRHLGEAWGASSATEVVQRAATPGAFSSATKTAIAAVIRILLQAAIAPAMGVAAPVVAATRTAMRAVTQDAVRQAKREIPEM